MAPPIIVHACNFVCHPANKVLPTYHQCQEPSLDGNFSSIAQYESGVLFPTAQIFQFSFGRVSGTGDEATDGSPTLDVAVPVVINIIPPNALLSADTIVTLSIAGGNATGRL